MKYKKEYHEIIKVLEKIEYTDMDDFSQSIITAILIRSLPGAVVHSETLTSAVQDVYRALAKHVNSIADFNTELDALRLRDI